MLRKIRAAQQGHAGDALRYCGARWQPEQFSVSERERRPCRARLMPTVSPIPAHNLHSTRLCRETTSSNC